VASSWISFESIAVISSWDNNLEPMMDLLRLTAPSGCAGFRHAKLLRAAGHPRDDRPHV
jgi:hypothetical protein